MNATPSVLTAHQGGWDELLIIAVPLVLYAAFRLWERSREVPEDDGTDDPPDEPPVAGR